jgi:hypothetical protein
LAEKPNLLLRSEHRFRSECSALAGDPYQVHHDSGRAVGRAALPEYPTIYLDEAGYSCK